MNINDRFDFTPPTWFKPDGTAMVWDAATKTYSERGGKKPMGTPGKDNSVPDTERATGGDNNLFDPTEPMDQVGNPMFEGFLSSVEDDVPRPGINDIATYLPQLVQEARGNMVAVQQLLTHDLMKHMGLENDDYGKNKLQAWTLAGKLIDNWEKGSVQDVAPQPDTDMSEFEFPEATGETVPPFHPWYQETPEDMDHLVRHAAGPDPSSHGTPFKPGDRVQIGGENGGEYGTVVEVQPPAEDYVPEECEMCGAPTEGNLDEEGLCRGCFSRPHEHDDTTWVHVKKDDGQTVMAADWMLHLTDPMTDAPNAVPATRETHPGPDMPEAIDSMIQHAHVVRSTQILCPECQQPQQMAGGKCQNCGHVFSETDGAERNLNTDFGPFNDVQPKEDFAHMPGVGVPFALGHKTAEAQPMGLGDNAMGSEINFDDMFQPGIVGGKHETHRFVLDPAHNMYIGPATMDHGQIVKQNGIQEFARGSVYGDGTAEINLQRMPGQIDRGSVEQQLQTHIGGPVSLTYMPQENTSTQETGGAFVAHGTAATETAGGGYAWRKESGVPSQELASSTPLVFVAEHAETTDYPIYVKCTGGFITATGGATSHAAVVARQSGQPCLVGIGSDYNKIGQGASVNIDGKGAVQVGPPNPKVQEYMQRGEGEWANAMDRRQDMEHEFCQRTPEWLRPNVGGSVDRPEEQPYQIVDGQIAPVVSATLDECPECRDPMVDREGQKLCSSCGHRQQIMYAATKESMDLSPSGLIGDVGGVGQYALTHPVQDAELAGLAAAAPMTDGADLALAPEVVGGSEVAPAVADAAGVGGIRGALQKVLNVGQGVGMAGMGLQGAGQAANMAGGAAGLNTPQGPDMSNEQAQLASVRRAATVEGMWDFNFDPRYADTDEGESSEDDHPIGVADDEDMEYPSNHCPYCGGNGELLGSLGKRKHYRCRDCGSDFSHQHRESNKTGDELEVGGQRDDGDDITDEQTQGARLDHGDETSGESLRDVGDTGSANSYDPAQSQALEAFQNEPNIKVFMESPESGRGHEGIEKIIDMLAKAFPGAFDDLLPDAHEPEHTDSVEDTNQGKHPQEHGSDMPDSKLGGTMDMTEQMIDFLRKQGYSVEAAPHRAPNDGARQHVPDDAPWVTKDGTKIEPGKRYMMTANGYSVPDDITVDQVTHNEIRYTIHGKGMDFPDTLDRKEFERQGGFDFELKADAPENIVHEVDQLEQMPAQNAGQDAGTADPGQQDDLSDLPTPVSHEQVGDSVFDNIPDEHIEQSGGGELIYRDPSTGEEMNYQQYAAHLAADAPEGMKWLWEDKSPTQDTEISDRMKGMMMATAGRNFTPAQQKEFIQEQGEARNLSKLDLKDTHYTEHDGSNVDDAECWFS